MGIGIHQELLSIPLTPIKTTCTASSTRKRDREEEEEDEAEAAASSCHTPKSSESNPPPQCPPPPTKPRPVRRKFTSDEAPKLGFFQVPEDLASVFQLITSSNKKIRTS